MFNPTLVRTAVGYLCVPNGQGIRYPCREEPTQQLPFAHAGHVTYSNAELVTLDSNAFVKLIGGDSVDPNLVHSGALLCASWIPHNCKNS